MRPVPPVQHLGKGSNGQVYGWDGACGMPLAVKHTVAPAKDVCGESTFWAGLPYETVAGALATALVILGVCPNICMQARARCRFRHRKRRIETVLYMERFAGDIQHCVELHDDPRAAVSCTFQVLAACSALESAFGMYHNDLYLRNVLRIPCQKEPVCYGMGVAGSFAVETRGIMYAICDFALCSSPRDLGRAHDSVLVHDASSGPASFRARTRHILEYTDIPAYLRDVGTFLEQMRLTTCMGLRSWFTAMLDILEADVQVWRSADMAVSGTLRDWTIADFVARVFDPAFLTRHHVPLDVVTPCRREEVTFETVADDAIRSLAHTHARDALIETVPGYCEASEPVPTWEDRKQLA